jgi:hypothetical protein
MRTPHQRSSIDHVRADHRPIQRLLHRHIRLRDGRIGRYVHRPVQRTTTELPAQAMAVFETILESTYATEARRPRCCAALLGEIGRPQKVMRGVAVVSRSAGLVGHIHEEVRKPSAAYSAHLACADVLGVSDPARSSRGAKEGGQGRHQSSRRRLRGCRRRPSGAARPRIFCPMMRPRMSVVPPAATRCGWPSCPTCRTGRRGDSTPSTPAAMEPRLFNPTRVAGDWVAAARCCI